MKLYVFLTLSLMFVASSLTGCAKKSEQQPPAQNETAPSPIKPVSARLDAAPVAQSQNSFDLSGVWVGTSGLDQQALQEKLASLPANDREALITRARVFDSIFMAYQFNADHTMEVDMEIVLPNQEKIKEQAFGEWQAVPGENNALLVTTIEHRENGPTEKTVKRFLILNENEFQIIPTNIAPELEDLKPFYLFQRQSLASIPLSAEAPSQEVLK